MKQSALVLAAVLSAAGAAYAQSPAEAIEQAIVKSPLRFPGQAAIIKWKPDYTYEIVRQGNNKLACYDRSDERGRSAFAAQCTNLANPARGAHNQQIRFETKNTTEEHARIAAAEKDGTRVKPQYGALWFRMDGAGKESAMLHVMIAVPGAMSATIGLRDNGDAGGAWVMEAGTSAAHIVVPGR